MDNQKREERKSSIGGADIGIILGLSKWKTPVQLWLEKTGRDTKKDEPTIPQEFGIFAEEFVARQYEKRTRRRVEVYEHKIVHPENPLFTGNIDRLVIPEGSQIASFNGELRTDRGMEAKAVSAYCGGEWGDDDSDDVPAIYMAQCQWYIGLHPQFRYWDLAALIGNARFEVYPFIRDNDMIQMLQARAAEWWNNYVVKDVAPPPMSEADVLALFPKHKPGKSVVADENICATLGLIKETKTMIAQYETQKECLQMQVKNFLKDSESAVVVDNAGKPLVTWKNNKDSVKTDWEEAYQELLRKVEIYKLIPPAEFDGLRKEIIAKHTETKPGARVFLVK